VKILLINPSVKNIIYSQLPIFLTTKVKYSMSLGLLYISAYVKHNSDYEINVLDCSEETSALFFKVEEFLLTYNPDLVGITGHTVNWIDMILLAKLIKKALPQVHITLGGAHANLFPKEVLSFSYIDSVVLGEGEKVFLELCNALETKSELSDIKGLITKEKIKTDFSNEFNSIKNLDSLPFPERDSAINLGEQKEYSRVNIKSPAFMMGSRGCPYSCFFCSKSPVSYRTRSIINIVDEMEECKRQGFNYIIFYDDVFNVTPLRVIELSEEILRRKLKLYWSFRTKVNNVNEKMLQLAKRAGCKLISYGVETSSNSGLRILNKEITIKDIEKTFYITRKAGIFSSAYFMLGCPHEKTLKDIEDTIKFAKKLNPKYAIFSVLTLYPNTKLYNLAITKNLISDSDWKRFVLNPSKDFYPPVWEESFTKKELYRMLNKAYRVFYLSSLKNIRKMISHQSYNNIADKIYFFIGVIKSK
jgi:anaerobic magnesium-protoporphyrin IX monomethyl ester cyclase